jgi:hypothetical protein
MKNACLFARGFASANMPDKAHSRAACQYLTAKTHTASLWLLCAVREVGSGRLSL